MPSIHFVHNRKNNPDKKKPSFIELRIIYKRKTVYISTGCTCLPRQWDADNECVVGCPQAMSLNKVLEHLRRSAYDIAADMVTRGAVDIAELAAMVKCGASPGEPTETFVDYVRRRINERADIRETTKKTQGKLPDSLEEFGIIRFSDLTRQRIEAYYAWFLDRPSPMGGKVKQSTAWSMIKMLRVYIHDAMVHGLITEDPSSGIKVPKGGGEPGRWLTEDELKRVEILPLDGHLSRARDLFLIQCYSGLAYADLMDFSADKIERTREGLELLVGRRVKTGEEYISVVAPELREVLARLGYTIPRISNQKYNDYISVVCHRAGIDRHVTSHWGRRTCGMLMLNRGYPIEAVARALGHKDIRVTQQAYARLIREGMLEAYLRVQKK